METTTFCEFPICVEFDYQPKENRTLTYPGCEASLEITSVMLGDIELVNQLTEEQLDYIEESCWDEVERKYENAI